MKVVPMFFSILVFGLHMMQGMEESTSLLKKLSLSPKSMNLSRIEDIKIRLYCERFPAFQLQQVSRLYCSLSFDARKKIKKLSEQVGWFHRVMELPEETQKQIFLSMLDGDEQAREKFYGKSIFDAFNHYHNIKKKIGRAQYPIGPLYKLSYEELGAKLQHINPWYYSSPIIQIADQAIIEGINKDEELKQYLKGEKVIVIPDGCNRECACQLSKKFCLRGSFLWQFFVE